MKLATTLLLVSVLGLLGVGLIMIYSVSPLSDGPRLLLRQLVAAALGLGGAIAAAGWFDYRRLKDYSLALWVTAVVLLAAVLIPHVGVEINGARRWFRLGGVQFQPSDFAKLAVLVALAHYGAHCQRLMRGFWRGIVGPAAIVGPVLVLIFREPDWGTALLLAGVSGIVLLVAGVRWQYLALPLILGGALVGAMLMRNPERSSRVNSWLHLEQTKDDEGFQVWQARLALGKGGATGTGLNRSTQKHFLPEHRTDFLFAIVGEEFGFAGSAAVIGAFVVFLVCALRIAWLAGDVFGLLLGSGIGFLIGLQALVNIAVVSGAVPNKGLPLPFLSLGGSNLMIMLFCVGLLLSIARHAPEAGPGEAGEVALAEAAVTRLS